MSIEDLKVKPEILSPKPPSIATDEEFASGTSTTASPTVKQVKENLVTIDTSQTITGFKRFSAGTLQALNPVLLKENNENEGGQIHFERSNNSVLNGHPYIDLWQNSIRFVGTNSNNTTNITLQVDLQNNQVLVPSPAATANDGQAATTAWVRNFLTPTGTIIIWSAPNPPAGYLVCNGAAISRTTYAALFNGIGTTWGAGDGNTTFNVPNFTDRYPVGFGSLGAVGTLLNQGLPNISGTFFGGLASYLNYGNGAFFRDATTTTTDNFGNGGNRGVNNFGFYASRSNSVYGATNRVQPFSSVVCFCIKY